MSSTKHITQGGQVFSYMLNMFMQVNRRIAFWLLNLFFVLTPLFFWMRVPWQDMRNGGLYWWLYLSAGGEKALFNVPPVYDVPYDGQTLHFTSAAILKDPYMTYAGQLTLLCCMPEQGIFRVILKKMMQEYAPIRYGELKVRLHLKAGICSIPAMEVPLQQLMSCADTAQTLQTRCV